MAKKSLIYPDSVRPPRALPNTESVRELGLPLSDHELATIQMAMAIHSASRQPKLLWSGWKVIAEACAIGGKYARKKSDGRLDSQNYRLVMTPFLNRTGFAFINKDDRACAVRLLPEWDDIDEWRDSLSPDRQRALNNPREVERVYNDELKSPKPGTAKAPPNPRRHHKRPKLLEEYMALVEQLELAEERMAQAERDSEFFAAMADATAKRAKLDDDAMAQIRTEVRHRLFETEEQDT